MVVDVLLAAQFRKVWMSHIKYAPKMYKEMAGTQYERYLWFLAFHCSSNHMHPETDEIDYSKWGSSCCCACFMRWVLTRAAKGWYRIICTKSVAKSQGKRNLGRRRSRWQDSIMMNLNKNILTLRSAEK